MAAWAMVTTLGWEGTPGAIVAVIMGMVISVALWTGLTVLLRALGWGR